ICAVAEKSIRLKTGARGLRSVLENLMLGCMFDAPGGNVEKVVITRDNVENGTEPTIIKRAS
ncbi:MAG: ATP-dependent Clp protease ATP-binding subunit ClpX, partial [Clostridia bacterium]|nr:ATP-dependent Clp protease ATP-binding subunit ClpX [Clostridia bacterium]